MSNDTITISREHAYALKYLLDDILNVQERANCSDRYFRTHFMNVVNAGISNGTYRAIAAALDEKPEAEAAVDEAPAPKKAAKRSAAAE